MPEEDELDADERKEIVADAVIEFEGALLAAYRSEQKISPMAVFIATLENAEAIEERMRALDMAVRIHIKTADSYGLVITTAVPVRNADLPTEPQAE